MSHVRPVETQDGCRGVRVWRAACLASAGLITGITMTVFAIGLLPGEVALRDLILAAADPRILTLARWVNEGGTWRFLVPATLALLVLSERARRRWWLWVVTFVGAPLIGEAWQEAVRRTRPHGTALGFPSGHATAAAAFAVVIVYLVSDSGTSRGWRLTGIVLGTLGVVAVGLARILLEAHWPADVLGGFAIGAGAAAGAAWWDMAHGHTTCAMRAK